MTVIISDTSENSVHFDSTFCTRKVNVHCRHTATSIPERSCGGYTTKWWHRSYGAQFYPRNPSKPRKVNTAERKTAKDEALQALKTQIAEGFPTHRKALKPILIPHWNIRNELSEADGLLFKGRQLIIPKTMQSSTLDLIHDHLGIEKCKASARAVCTGLECHATSTTRLRSVPSASHTDTTDDSTRHTRSPMAKARIWCIWAQRKTVPSSSGLLLQVHRDEPNAWQNRRNHCHAHEVNLRKAWNPWRARIRQHAIQQQGIQTLCKWLGIQTHHLKSHLSSSERSQWESCTDHQANSLKTSDPYIGLLECRNTPVTGMTSSPSQLPMSRATRTKIPVATELLQPKLVTEVYQQLKACQQR